LFFEFAQKRQTAEHRNRYHHHDDTDSRDNPDHTGYVLSGRGRLASSEYIAGRTQKTASPAQISDRLTRSLPKAYASGGAFFFHPGRVFRFSVIHADAVASPLNLGANMDRDIHPLLVTKIHRSNPAAERVQAAGHAPRRRALHHQAAQG
jgi:hypothetical protein